MKKESTSPPSAGTQVQVGKVTGALRKVFSGQEGGPPSPVFVNATDFVGLGSDVILDLGIVSPESVNAANAKGATPLLIDFNVIARFAMSIPTAATLHQRLSMILAQIPAQAKDVVTPVRKKEEVK
ncbi:MAG: hypothetical protein WB341_07805 [Terracidiphilus sp.]